MSNCNRRHIFHSAAALSALPLLLSDKAEGGEPREPIDLPVPGAKPFIHVTDLFRPHNDPDDHWDLATGYALAYQGDLNLLAVLVDNPKNIEEMPELQKELDDVVDDKVYVPRSPDVAAVAQLNYITGKAVPVTTGTIWPGKPGEKVREDNLPKALQGVNVLLDILKRSSQPVAILIGGSCQDVAIAGKKEPRLFAEKCAGIYLNVGCGSPNPADQSPEGSGSAEWNVGLNPSAYAAIFELPCPIYWMPCVYGATKTDTIPGEYATWWRFRQKEVIPHLSDRLQAYFAYVLSKESGTNWLSYLLDPSSKKVAQKYLDDERGMFCTAGFLHMAGRTVTSDGQVVSLDARKETAVYEFVPIEIHCDENGITNWRKSEKSTNRWIYRVKDKAKHREAMVSALKSILLKLP